MTAADGFARRHRSARRVRWIRRRRRRLLRRPSRRGPIPHRPERRRQDDLHRRHHRPVQGHRIGEARRPGAARQADAQDRPARSRPHLPDRERLRAALGAAEPRHRGRAATAPRVSLLRARRGVDPAIELALEETGLSDERDTPAGILSHGQKQWLEIGMMLVQEPAGAAARRARRRHEPGRADRDRRAAAAHRRAPHRARRRARHGLHAPLRIARDGAAPGQGALGGHGGAGAGRPQGAGGLPRHRRGRDHGRHARSCADWRRPQSTDAATQGEGA